MVGKRVTVELTGPECGEDGEVLSNLGMPWNERLARFILLLERGYNRTQARKAQVGLVAQETADSHGAREQVIMPTRAGKVTD